MNKRRIIKTGLALLIIGGSFGAVLIVLLRFADGPATGSASSLLAQAQGTPTPTPDTTAAVQGQYVAFSYPALFDAVANTRTDSNALEQFSIAAKSNYRLAIQAHVGRLPVGGLNEDSSYRLRTLSPDIYKPTDVLAGPDRGVMMAKTDGSEVTMFVPHADKLLTIAVTSADTKHPPKDILDVIRPTVRWQP